MLWKVERKSVDFPPFPPFQWRMGEKRERGNERERNSIAGGWKIVVHENIARLTVNDLNGVEQQVVNDFNRRPSTGKKAHRPERNFERRKRTDFPIFRYENRSTESEPESSRGKYNVLYEFDVACRAYTCNTSHTRLCVASKKWWIYYAQGGERGDRKIEAKSRFHSARFNAYPLQHVVQSMRIDEDG